MEVPNNTPTEPARDSKTTDGHALWVVFVLVLSLICIALVVMIWGMQTSGDLEMEQRPNEDGIGLIEEDTEGKIPLIMSIHMESSSSRVCDETDARCATDEEWEYLLGVTETLIQSLDENNLKGTFQMQSHWMTRLQDSDRGIAIIDSMVDGGHEVAVHRHGFTHNDWDGYSDNEEAHDGHDVYTELEARPMSELMEIIHGIEEKWDIQITTVEGTDLMTDRSDEWIFQTGDDGNNKYVVELNDPDGYCPEGRPTWSRVTLPNHASGMMGQDVTTIPHTWMGAQTADCTRTVGAHILQIAQDMDPDEWEQDRAINIVYHPKDMGTNQDNLEAFLEIFAAFGEMDHLIGMTVQEYMCDRVEKCI